MLLFKSWVKFVATLALFVMVLPFASSSNGGEGGTVTLAAPAGGSNGGSIGGGDSGMMSFSVCGLPAPTFDDNAIEDEYPESEMFPSHLYPGYEEWPEIPETIDVVPGNLLIVFKPDTIQEQICQFYWEWEFIYVHALPEANGHM